VCEEKAVLAFFTTEGTEAILACAKRRLCLRFLPPKAPKLFLRVRNTEGTEAVLACAKERLCLRFLPPKAPKLF